MRAPGRAVAVGVCAAAMVVLAPRSAWADVSVVAQDPTPGAPAAVTLRVVNTRPATDLTAVHVEVPADVGSVTVGDMPGWTLGAVAVVAGRPTAVEWTASTAPMAPGSHVDFTVLLGTLPAQSALMFPTVETYRDGDRTFWGTTAPGPVVALPAPTLSLSAVPTAGTQGPTGGTDGLARLLAMAALLLGLIGCAIVVQSTRSQSTPGAPTMLGLPARLFPAEMSRPAEPTPRPDRTTNRPD